MKKIISAILITAVLTGTTASAIEISEDWINISAWAYTDVSNFTNEGLMPESFKGINDYRIPITREQFAELVYPIYSSINDDYIPEYQETFSFFSDTDNYAVNRLGWNSIVLGIDNPSVHVIDETSIIYIDNSSNTETTNNRFMPDSTITREDAAVIAYRAGNFSSNDIAVDDSGKLSYALSKTLFTDDADISDYASFAVYHLNSIGIISGMEDGSFNPKGNITIEQAISMLYRLYQHLPAVPKADGADITAKEETLLKTYDNGFTETKLGNMLYIKDNDTALMKFETDMYFKLDCVSYNGKNYVLARNFNKKTEVFDMESHDLLFTIPFPVSKSENGYIYTISTDNGKYQCGLYDFDGNEILPTEYSEYEINKLIENNFASIEAPYRAPDGWLYYSDWNDSGHMYKIDSNGENKQLLSNEDCYHIHYIDGWLYFHIRSDSTASLYAMKPDGTEMQKISGNAAFLLNNHTDNISCYTTDENGYVYYCEQNRESLGYSSYYSSNEILLDEYTSLWRCKPGDNGFTKEKLSDICIIDYQMYNNRVYFMDDKQNDEEGAAYLYCFDGEKIVQLTDIAINSYAIEKDWIRISVWETNELYDIDLDGSNIRESEYRTRDWSNGYDTETNILFLEDVSNDKYKIYNDFNNNVTYFTDADGNQITFLYENRRYMYRFENTLYYTQSLTENGGVGLYSYDMDNNIRTKITDNCKYFVIVPNVMLSKDDVLIYADYYGNLYKIEPGSTTSVQIYPNSGSNKYDEVMLINSEISDIGIMKLGTSGVFTTLTDDFVRYWSYTEDNQEISWGEGNR